MDESMSQEPAEATETEPENDEEVDEVEGHSMAISANFAIDIGGTAVSSPASKLGLAGFQPPDPKTDPTRQQ